MGDDEMMAWFKYFTHNCLIHPMLPFLPYGMGERLHAWNARWAFETE
jgi:hypothetical protein